MHIVRFPMWQTQSVGPVENAHISVLRTVNNAGDIRYKIFADKQTKNQSYKR